MNVTGTNLVPLGGLTLVSDDQAMKLIIFPGETEPFPDVLRGSASIRAALAQGLITLVLDPAPGAGEFVIKQELDAAIAGLGGGMLTSGWSGFSGTLGQVGPIGLSGTSGQSGTSGRSGFSGGLGPQGPQGLQGYSGKSGISGFSGGYGTSGFSGALPVPTVSALIGALIIPDASIADVFTLLLAQTTSMLPPTSMTDGESISIMITQDGTGGRVLSFGSALKFPGGAPPVVTAAANATDLLVIDFIGGKYLCRMFQNFS